LPNESDLDLTGLKLPAENIKELLRVDPQVWQAELEDIEEFFARFGGRLPERLRKQLGEFAARLG
jgi:phosphoenolpyruvate carboxykinase (GTP)